METYLALASHHCNAGSWILYFWYFDLNARLGDFLGFTQTTQESEKGDGWKLFCRRLYICECEYGTGWLHWAPLIRLKAEALFCHIWTSCVVWLTKKFIFRKYSIFSNYLFYFIFVSDKPWENHSFIRKRKINFYVRQITVFPLNDSENSEKFSEI